MYYVAPVEEAERIGFRDDFIYETIQLLRTGVTQLHAINLEHLNIPQHTERMKKIYTQYQQCGQLY